MRNTLVFTICSNNYLAQAKSLGDSLVKYNPDFIFVIGLTDEKDEHLDYGVFQPFHLLPVADIDLKNLDELWKKYGIVEFNTCVKPSYFKYLFKYYSQVTSIFYFDPDILIYSSLRALVDIMDDHDIMLTPHILTPIQLDGSEPGENLFLNHGLYNLGFLGVSRSCFQAGVFLDWWETRTFTCGFDKVWMGFFVDQLWINFVPLFFPKVKILADLGCNMAPWNLHERRIVGSQSKDIMMSDGTPLIFYHFSSFKFYLPEVMSQYYHRYNFKTNPELCSLYQNYRNLLLENNIEQWYKIPCAYVLKKEQYTNELERPNIGKRQHKLLRIAKLFIPPIVHRLYKFLS